MNKYLLLLCLSLLIKSALLSQQADSWIDYNQTYYKLKVAEDGFYRITATQMQAAGIPITTIASSRFQMFRNGEELAIDAPVSDNRVEYIEFYGEKNRGESDQALYVSPDAHQHPYYSLFSDSATYFLTWTLLGNDQDDKIIEFDADKDATGLSPESYHIKSQQILETNRYARGKAFGTQNVLTSAKYDFGEGWTGSAVNRGNKKSYTFDLSGFNSSAPPPALEVILLGGNNLDHLVDIQVGEDDSNVRNIGSVSFAGQINQTFNSDLDWSDIGSGDELLVEVVATGFPDQSENISVSAVTLNYSSTFQTLTENTSYVLDIVGGEQRKYIRIPTTAASDFLVYDITDNYNPRWLAGTAFSDRIEFVVDVSNANTKLFLRNSVSSIDKLELVDFEPYDFSTMDYIMVAHKDLREPVDGQDPVISYANYRESAAGGSYNVGIVDIDVLFDQYNYGDPSPLAIRNLFLLAASQNVDHALIIGKGRTVNFNDYRSASPTGSNHYIPTFGLPGSDLLFAVDDSSPNAQLHIGRLNVTSASQIMAYLDKVKEMEALPYDALWRKNMILLSGGQSTTELRSFASYVQDFKQAAEGDFLGGKAVIRQKQSSSVIEEINVSEEINNGTSLVTFFGHSSAQATDIEIGNVSNSNLGYNNSSKYPMFLVNGCNAGEIFGNSLTFGENWMYTAGLGAIGFVAHAEFALSSNLKRYSDLFYQYGYVDEGLFGSSIGEILNTVQQQYFERYTESDESQSQIYNMLFQGDPVIKLFGAKSPDYDINDDFISVEAEPGENLVSSSPSFNVKVNVKNYGKTVVEQLPIRINRTLPNGTVVSYDYLFDPIKYQDTLLISVPNEPENVNTGTNIIQIQLDPENLIPELNKTNNSAQISFFLPEGSAILLFPVPYSSEQNAEIELVWQAADPSSGTREYVLEIDTTYTFESPFLKRLSVSGELLFRQKNDFSVLPDSTSVFWRTRYANFEEDDDTSWVASTFNIMAGSEPGWSQIADTQFDDNLIEGVIFDDVTRQLDFIEEEIDIEINTHGIDRLTSSYEDLRVVINGINYLLTDNPFDPTCRTNTINAVVFDRETGNLIRPFGDGGRDVFNSLICGLVPQKIHNFNENNVLGSRRYLDSLVSIIDEGTTVLLFSFDSVAYSNWDDRIKTSLEQIGIDRSVINGLVDGQPVVFLGKKGMSPGEATILVSDGSGVPPKEQALEFIGTAFSKFSQGSINSLPIGPALNWNSFNYNVSQETTDASQFNIIGIDAQGNEAILQTTARLDESDLSAIDAQQYPYLKVDWFFSDLENQTPPQPRSWSVSYTAPPDGLLSSSNSETVVLDEGNPFVQSFDFINISTTDFQDSIQAVLRLSNLTSGSVIRDTVIVAAPLVGDTSTFASNFSTVGKTGDNNLFVSVEAQQTEQYALNNVLNYSKILNVIPDDTNPLLDVTFDGNYILAGDIVSPNPLIEVKLKDENEFLLKEDTTGVNISLRLPCDGCEFERVSFSDASINFTPATDEQDFMVEYRPGPLSDGVYGVRVQATDASGNQSGSKPFETTFEVINESSISHFYPYPNPFSTSMRFVFTLTGMDLPEAIKVQIMTVSGRVVKEINQSELGSIKIGNNISEYAWDGKDEYGDQLANGVYFYKVFIKKSGEPFEHFDTSADRAFKNGFGKIYLLR